MNILQLVALVLPGYFAVLLNEFIWGRRGRPSADRILDASLLSIISSALLAFFGHAPFSGTDFGGAKNVGEILSVSVLRDLAYITVVAIVFSMTITVCARASWFRRISRRFLRRTLTFDVLYDRYLDALAAHDKNETARVTSGKAKRPPIAIVKLKSGVHIKGVIEALTDQQADGGMFISNPDLYDKDFADVTSLNVFSRDEADRVLEGAGIYVRRSEIEQVWLAVDEQLLLRFRARRAEKSPVPRTLPSLDVPT